MNTIYCSIDSVKFMPNMAIIFSDSQNKNASACTPECLLIICVTIVLVVCIICLFVYLIGNRKKQESIKNILKNDEGLKKEIQNNVKKTDEETLRNIVEDIWQQKVSLICEQVISDKDKEKIFNKYISEEIKRQLPKLLDAVKIKNK